MASETAIDNNLSLLACYLGKADAAIGCLVALCGEHDDLARMNEAVAAARDALKSYVLSRLETEGDRG